MLNHNLRNLNGAFSFAKNGKMVAVTSIDYKNVDKDGYKLNTGFLGTAILNQTLTEVGLNNEAYTLLLQRNDPSWLYSIDQGATTIWERWNSYTVANGYGPVSMNSFNHYAYGIVAEWMYRYMAGIVPDEANAGFRHFILAPNPDRRPTLLYSQKRITSVDAQHWSPVGAIKASWQCDGGDEMTYVVTVPANTTCSGLGRTGLDRYAALAKVGSREKIECV